MDLHRHDEDSTFDGFGKADELAKIAKEKGYTWLGISNHGTTAGNIKHYFACKEQGIKPIMGVECYHEPVFDPEAKSRKSYHLCLFAKTLKGYQNINKIMTLAEDSKYYTARVTFDLLERYHEGVIATSACIASYPAQAIVNKKSKHGFLWLKKMKKIFGDDFYVEIQPYKVSDDGLQEKINKILIEMADTIDVKCILTSDSHRGRKDDFDSYLKMHQIGKTKYDVENTYRERYMPERSEMYSRFIKMHSTGKYSVSEVKERANEFMRNLMYLASTVEKDIIDQMPSGMPVFGQGLSHKQKRKMIEKEIEQGLRNRRKFKREYAERCKHELDIIDKQGFVDYFLVVQEYIQYAKKNKIMVGNGRGSVCNSLVAYAMGITNVDSIKYDLDFRRFMRLGKNKFPKQILGM